MIGDNNNMNNISLKDVANKCTGCGACFGVCPTKCIELISDQNGFYKPIIDASGCINCGACSNVCIIDKEIYKNSDFLKCYSFKSNNTELLLNSSSGAASETLMSELVNQGYLVVGCEYNKKEKKAKHSFAYSNEAIKRYKGAKYQQSWFADVYKEIMPNKNKKIAIFGTPCQIFAVSNFISVKMLSRNNFLLISIMCYGCTTPLLWEKEIEYITDRFKSDVVDIHFRSKIVGWHTPCNEFKLANGKTVPQKHHIDPFLELFYSNEMMNDACYKCQIRSTIFYEDIRIGDFWGSIFAKDKTGVSCVICSTSAGNNLFKRICATGASLSVDMQDITIPQSFNKRKEKDEEIRSDLFDCLKNKSIKFAFKKYRKTLPILKRFKQKIKYILNKS